MQFHPTTLYPTGILLTEGCRGEGAYLINSEGERFMKRYAPNAMELASRDVVSRSEQTEIDAGRGINGSVMLDMRHLGAERIIERLPGSRELSMTFAGVDPIYDPVPVRPGAHYHMGGVETGNDGETELTGLYAAGEVACVSVHGANRLGGNSLMETITFGRRAGRAAAEWALSHTTIDVPRERRGRRRARAEATCWTSTSGERPWQIRNDLGTSMLENFGVFRREEQMASQIEIIDELRERYERGVLIEDKGEVFNSDLTQAIELGNMIDLAACMLQAGIARKESRGAHARPVRLSRPRRRELHEALDHALGRTTARSSRGRKSAIRSTTRWSGRTSLMQVGLKIWRFNSRTGERELQEFEIDAPEEATLLDCLDIVKDQHDGTLAYRKSCRMMICGSCGMRMDGAAVLACKMRMYDIAQAGHVPVISAMGNLPIVKDLVVDMEPFWEKFNSRRSRTCSPATRSRRTARSTSSRQERMNVVHKEALCINCGCCVSECNAMEADPLFTGPQALAKAMRFVGDPRDGQKLARLEKLNGEHGIWECTRCYFCNERCPKGVDPRDAIAKLGAESMKEGIDRDMGAKHAKWFVTSAKTTGWLRETELVPKTQGIVAAIKQTRFALDLAGRARCRRRSRRTSRRTCKEARRLHDLVARARAARVTRASCRASTRSRGSRTATRAKRRSRRSTTGPARSTGRSSPDEEADA